MRYLNLIVAASALALGGCADEPTVSRAPLLIAPAEAPIEVAAAPESAARSTPMRALRVGGGSTNTGTAVSPTAKAGDGLRGISSEFPWGNGGEESWNGTGATDPEPLKKISDEEMLKRASNLEDQWSDRQHALVSIGRRHVPGAMEVYRQAMQQSQERAVREMALSGLMEHGGTEALPLMWDMLRNDVSPQLRGQAIWAVALYGPDEARKAIDHGLADEALQVRNMATLAIWALKDRPDEALPLLQAAIDSEESMIFQEGFYNLSRMPYPEAGNILERAARSAKDEDRLQRAAFAYRAWRRNFPDLKQ